MKSNLFETCNDARSRDFEAKNFKLSFFERIQEFNSPYKKEEYYLFLLDDALQKELKFLMKKANVKPNSHAGDHFSLSFSEVSSCSRVLGRFACKSACHCCPFRLAVFMSVYLALLMTCVTSENLG